MKDPAAPHHSQARPGTLRRGRSSTLRAVLFDMDGTLVATEQYWDRALVELGAGWGRTVGPEVLASTSGVDLDGAMTIVRTAIGVTRTPAEAADDRACVLARVGELMAGSSSWQPGARELVVECLGAGVRAALVTSTPRTLVTSVLRHLHADLGADPFEVVVCGDEVPARKPDPAPYLQAMAAMGLTPADCVVVEDSFTGSRAGLDAGCRVFAVPSGQVLAPEPGLTVGATLAGVTPALLAALPHPARA